MAGPTQSVLPSFTGPVFQGVINEEETEVGTVHLGLVHVLTIQEVHSLQPGDELVDFQWVERKRAGELNLELWSRLALELVDARRSACIIQLLHF